MIRIACTVLKYRHHAFSIPFHHTKSKTCIWLEFNRAMIKWSGSTLALAALIHQHTEWIAHHLFRICGLVRFSLHSFAMDFGSVDFSFHLFCSSFRIFAILLLPLIFSITFVWICIPDEWNNRSIERCSSYAVCAFVCVCVRFPQLKYMKIAFDTGK